MPQNQNNEVTLEDVRIVFRNFAGVARKFNDAGKRNFAVVLTDEMATELEQDSWNVKRRPPREDDEDPFNILKVKVSFQGRPPRLVLLSRRGRTTLDEETAELMDFVEIDKVDLIIRPYDVVVDGKAYRSAYLKTIYVTMHEDDLDVKYAEFEEITSAEEPRALTAESYLDVLEDEN